VLLTLLIVGGACLALGVLFASSPWLIAALAVGAAAAVLLYRQRYHIGRPAGARPAGSAAAGPAPVATALVTGTAFAARGGSRLSVGIAAQRPDLRVWVVDGRPAYHLGQCTMLDDVPAGAIPERVPLAQALEDGFVACPTCQPSEERISAGSAALIGDVAAGTEQDEDADAVWVVDGRPRYHRPGCAVLGGVPAERIPRRQARADGFTPCPRCDPESGSG
jgi:hypothetical protein